MLATTDPQLRWTLAAALLGSSFRLAAASDLDLDELVERHPDVCLVDDALPGGGLDVVRALRDGSPSTAVVLLASTDDDDHLLAALAAGVAGCLVKSGRWDRLAPTLAGVLRGEPVLPRTLVARLVNEVRTRRGRWIPLGPAARRLTDREWEILEQLAGGLSSNEIAARLGVKPVTVRTHAASVVRKLGVPDRAAAVALARRSLERP